MTIRKQQLAAVSIEKKAIYKGRYAYPTRKHTEEKICHNQPQSLLASGDPFFGLFTRLS